MEPYGIWTGRAARLKGNIRDSRTSRNAPNASSIQDLVSLCAVPVLMYDLDWRTAVDLYALKNVRDARKSR